jgi:hypothetical protein
MNINLNYAPATLAELVEAIATLRELGLSPAVTVSTPSPRPTAKGDVSEPHVSLYMQGMQGAGVVDKFFRLEGAESAAGLTRDAAAKARMERDGWQGEGDYIPSPDMVARKMRKGPAPAAHSPAVHATLGDDEIL